MQARCSRTVQGAVLGMVRISAADVVLSSHVSQSGVGFFLSSKEFCEARERRGLTHSDSVDETGVRD